MGGYGLDGNRNRRSEMINSYISSKTLVLAGLIAIGLMFTISDGVAAVIVYDGFDMGETSGGLSGKTSSTSFGLDGSWSTHGTPGTAQYLASGLTFGSGSTELVVTGGAARIDNTSSAFAGYNGLNVSESGTIYASYLFQTHSSRNDGENTFMVTGNSDVSHGGKGEFTVQGSVGGGLGRVRFTNNNGDNLGTAITANTTYMALFKVTPGSGNASIKDWILTSDQFDNFRAGGLNESALDSASLGTGATSVLQRGSLGNGSASFDSDKNLVLGVYKSEATFDEIRFSNTGFDEVAPIIPEPTTISVLLMMLGVAYVRRRVTRA